MAIYNNVQVTELEKLSTFVYTYFRLKLTCHFYVRQQEYVSKSYMLGPDINDVS